MTKKPLSDADIKAKLIAKAAANQPKDSLFPTEIVPLPSRGLVYPTDHPLSSGQVEVKYMTAKEEDILTNTNLLKTGRALDALYASLIVGNGEGEMVSLEDMIVGDKSALMLATRILGYGAEYPITVLDDAANEFEHTVDLNTLKIKKVDYSVYKNTRELDYTLPVAKSVVTFKLKNSKEENALTKVIAQMAKAGKHAGITTGLKHSIVAIDGDRDAKAISDFIDTKLIARDSLQLRLYMAQITPDYDLTISIDRPDKGVVKELQLPIDTDFFWPRS
jgi:hypothetical protein|tara:strand:+ start:2058 stop:2888 length:831 start_codon:yes stop_codon:yes gene_type:complete